MKKIFHWVSNNILFLVLLFLLAFIPLYPKKPLIDIVNTWVYIRLEDFIVVAVLGLWTALLIRKKITLKTPLTMPILLFWLVGVVSTLHGVLLIFPEIANVFPNVALLSFLRRIEYLSLFFVAFSAMRDKKMLPWVAAILVITLFAVVAYGIGQRYAGFPAYLTMNEEFAKGEPIRLSPLSRVPSTFAGHYDLAAYLVLVIPIVASLIFGVRKWFIKLILIAAVGAGFVLLSMTVSRVSFFVLFVGLAVVLFFQKRKWFLFSLPVVALIVGFLLLNFAPRLVDRFDSTVKEINVLVNAKTGEALGNIKDITLTDLEGKTVRGRVFISKEAMDSENEGKEREATSSAIVDPEDLPATGVQLVPPNVSTGENLPQGTGYINLPLSPIREQRGEFFYEYVRPGATQSAEIQMFSGKFLVKKALAYDLSLTIRYQGGWPNALEAFKRNIFFGSGYGSVSLAIDNSYLRMLGEVGLLGFIAFIIIFIIVGAYIKHTLSQVSSPFVRSFVIGFVAGVFGLILNAVLIDVFEASKVAFYLWMLTGVTLGILYLYQTRPFAFFSVLKKAATSSYAVVVYLLVLTFFILSPMLGNYFVGDDFTWLRWAAEGGISTSQLWQYFTQSDGFFYRPGTKTLFALLYPVFWLNPVVYHVISLILHAIVVILIFVLAKKILRNFGLSVLAAFLFVMLSSYHEAVFWISSIGHLFSGMFVLLSLWLFTLWEEKKKLVFFVLSLVSITAGLLFQEMAVIAPLIIIFYKFVYDEFTFKNIRSQKILYGLFFSPVILYLFVRFISQSHWAGGDYTYNLLKLPFNIIGNSLGYLMLSFLGPLSLGPYEIIRMLFRENILIAAVILVVLTIAVVPLYRKRKTVRKDDKQIIFFSLGFMFLSVLPFIGLGNITSRYTYLFSFGFVLLLAFLIYKLYRYLLSNGRDIAVSVVSLCIGLFFLVHVIQIQQIHGDWYEAGLKVNRFITGIEGAYLNYWSEEPMEFFVVDLPVRTGEAWVFPVGITDALWFIFKNPDITIRQFGSVDEAIDAVTNIRNQKVFLFDRSGDITEQRKLQKINEN